MATYLAARSRHQHRPALQSAPSKTAMQRRRQEREVRPSSFPGKEQPDYRQKIMAESNSAVARAVDAEANDVANVDVKISEETAAVGASTTDAASKPPAPSYALSSTISKKYCICITCLILLSHGLFLWGQLDALWGQYVTYNIDVGVSSAANESKNLTLVDKDETYVMGDWSYGAMLNELWKYSKVTAVFLFAFSALWPHLKLVLLHVYFYLPVPSGPRRAAMYWLDAMGKMSLTDVCATCMLFLLLNLQADIDVQSLVANGSELIRSVLFSRDPISMLLSNGLLNNTDINNGGGAASILGDAAEVAEGFMGGSFDVGDSSSVYKTILETGCSKFHNEGETCVGTPFYEPAKVVGGIAGIMMKCLRIRNDNCYQW